MQVPNAGPPHLVRFNPADPPALGRAALELAGQEVLLALGKGSGDAGVGPKPTAVEGISTKTGRVLWRYPIPAPHKVGEPVWSGHAIEFIEFPASPGVPELIQLSVAGRLLAKIPLGFLPTADVFGTILALPSGILAVLIKPDDAANVYNATYTLAMIGYGGHLHWETKGVHAYDANGVLADEHIAVWTDLLQDGTTRMNVLSVHTGKVTFSLTATDANPSPFLVDGVLLVNGRDSLTGYAESGRRLWRLPGSIPWLTANSSSLVKPLNSHTVQVVDIRTGRPVKTIHLGTRTFGQAVAVSSSYVVLGLWGRGRKYPLVGVYGIQNRDQSLYRLNWVNGCCPTMNNGAKAYTFPNGVAAGFALVWAEKKSAPQ